MTSDMVFKSRSIVESDRILVQLTRFAILGGVSNILYAVLFFSLASHGALLANFTGVVASTALANELHRRFTFRASDRVGWFRAQWEAGGVAAVGLAATTGVTALLASIYEQVASIVTISTYVFITGTVGLIRFVTLRGWVFSIPGRR